MYKPLGLRAEPLPNRRVSFCLSGESRGQVDVFPSFRFSLFPEADGTGAPWRRPDKGSRSAFGLSLGLARPTSIAFDCLFFQVCRASPTQPRWRPDSLAISTQMFSSRRNQQGGSRSKATKAYWAALSPDAKIDPRSAAGVIRIPLIEASGTSCGAPPPSSNSLLSLCESRGQVDVFPCPDSPFFPKPMELASPGTVPTKVHNALQVHLESHV